MFRRGRAERDLPDELETFVDMAAADAMRAVVSTASILGPSWDSRQP
jgi:hypothetical protein